MVVKQRQKLLRVAGEPPPLEIFRAQLDMVLSTALADPVEDKGLN